MTQIEVLQEISDTLISINDCLEGIGEELEEISMASKMMIFFKLIELKPEMKDKLGPLINELAESMDFTMDEAAGEE
ncbi:MAG TPA: hypothetical protein PLO30_01660 [Methanothrix soehngenii]|jgi:hypothetical protein|uniref:Uncharacterized protein n=3 Tax=root TaxID=1 RepID=F4BUP0_METSG|nr:MULTISPECIES: hypothetical protein [Methanothrix]AEB68280.1 conserved hypothetical protein [Methanothrix soehngenii GP6]MDD3551419.1 hypothetical protein [Methanothrix soehngenii]MDD5257405.1 hypothetical protein [Methanothrix soehngenii]MDY0411716.1 hypothetical protein [Methanothrix soehngenii]HNQ52328.1 hypothetical protein [Methanothrix soehngenii]